MGAMQHFIGIDIGTSSVKSLIINENGDIVSQASEGLIFNTPQPNWAEQDPHSWWQGVSKTVVQAMKIGKISAGSIAGISLSGQMHSLVLLDKNYKILRPSILWCDARTTDQCQWINKKVGEENLVEWVSNPALEGFTAPKLIWVRENEPQVYEQIRHVLLPKDYIRFLMTNEFAMDVSDASGTLLFDVRNRQWSDPLLNAIELPNQIMPPTFESVDICGYLTSKVAKDWGLKPGIPVAGGGADNTCGAIGSGIIRPGRILSSIGTSGVIFAHTNNIRVDPKLRVHTFCHSVPNKWYLMGVSLFAGGAFQWLRNTFGHVEISAAKMLGADPYQIMTSQAERADIGSDGLVFLPYLMGERTPHKDANARGGFVGLTARHERSHMIRSVMEGVTFALNDSIEIMRQLGVSIDQVRSIGGGARSFLWRQMQADIYGAEVVTVNADEGPAFGAAILAAVGTGCYGSVEEATDQLVTITSTTEPNAQAEKKYRGYYEIFKSLYPALKPSFDAITAQISTDQKDKR
tara:strand:- start:106219 stop:107778 length:1560 start_codon:yes stop_codon:yes gene_type:complete